MSNFQGQNSYPTNSSSYSYYDQGSERSIHAQCSEDSEGRVRTIIEVVLDCSEERQAHLTQGDVNNIQDRMTSSEQSIGDALVNASVNVIMDINRVPADERNLVNIPPHIELYVEEVSENDAQPQAATPREESIQDRLAADRKKLKEEEEKAAAQRLEDERRKSEFLAREKLKREKEQQERLRLEREAANLMARIRARHAQKAADAQRAEEEKARLRQAEIDARYRATRATSEDAREREIEIEQQRQRLDAELNSRQAYLVQLGEEAHQLNALDLPGLKKHLAVTQDQVGKNMVTTAKLLVFELMNSEGLVPDFHFELYYAKKVCTISGRQSYHTGVLRVLRVPLVVMMNRGNKYNIPNITYYLDLQSAKKAFLLDNTAIELQAAHEAQYGASNYDQQKPIIKEGYEEKMLYKIDAHLTCSADSPSDNIVYHQLTKLVIHDQIAYHFSRDYRLQLSDQTLITPFSVNGKTTYSCHGARYHFMGTEFRTSHRQEFQELQTQNYVRIPVLAVRAERYHAENPNRK